MEIQQLHNLIRLKIFTPYGIKFDQDIRMVEIKTSEGYIGLMCNHVPFAASLQPNVVYITYEDGTRESAVLDSATVFSTRKIIKIFGLNFVLTKNIDFEKASQQKKLLEEQLTRINDVYETFKLERMLSYELLKLKQTHKK